MTQDERLDFLIESLISELSEHEEVHIPKSVDERKLLLRSLFNVRPPIPVGEEFLRVQDEYLRAELEVRGVVSLEDLDPVEENLYLWKGDITTLKVDAIVNAANSQMLGCFVPCHKCIDNAIHTYAGVQLRLACAELMDGITEGEPTGRAKITPAFNLPSKYVIHTVGPIVRGNLTQKDCDLLASCYKSCLKLAKQNGLHSIAFCCISTGEFGFPNDKAAAIALSTVKEYLKKTESEIKVIFDVFKESDYAIYRRLFGSDRDVKK